MLIVIGEQVDRHDFGLYYLEKKFKNLFDMRFHTY